MTDAVETAPQTGLPPAAVQPAVQRRPLLQLRGVSQRYGQTDILVDVNIDVDAGRFVCVVGPSGCGKTTLLRICAGLQQPSAGQVTLLGRQLREPDRSVAVVFQDYGRALLPWRTVQQNVELALINNDQSRGEIKAAVDASLDLTGLSQHGKKYPGQLSGGMQQRVQIARAIAQKPRLILMDEPFGALDAFTRQTLQDEARRIVEGAGASVLFITHDLEEAIYLGDSVTVLGANPGRVLSRFDVELPAPRDHLRTKEDTRFLRYRHALYELLGARH